MRLGFVASRSDSTAAEVVSSVRRFCRRVYVKGDSLLRVTGGCLGGRLLTAPHGGKVRPSSDRVREALFARVGDLSNARVLDLYAGSGALGIEALSRGADFSVFVEQSKSVTNSIRKNLASLELLDRSRILRSPALSALRRLGRDDEVYDIVFLDPPYSSREIPKAMGSLRRAGVLVLEGLVVVESCCKDPTSEFQGFRRLDQRRYGDTMISRYILEEDSRV